MYHPRPGTDVDVNLNDQALAKRLPIMCLARSTDRLNIYDIGNPLVRNDQVPLVGPLIPVQLH